MIEMIQTADETHVARGLSPQDTALNNWDRKISLIRDRTRSVAEHCHNGLYLYGRPGTGKTHSVMQELNDLDVPYAYRNARLTAMGLSGLIESFPGHTLVLDDQPGLIKDKQAQQILMAALGGKPGNPRTVTYEAAHNRRSTQFSGGIIVISNVALGQDPLAEAIQSRVTTLKFDPTDEEMVAHMRELTSDGWQGLAFDEAKEVVDFVIDEARMADIRLDLRTLEMAFQDYGFYRDGKSLNHWHDLIRSSVHKRPTFSTPVSQKQQEMRQEREIALELFSQFPERNQKAERDQAWQAKTGKSPDTLYRHRTALKAANEI